MSGIMLYVIIEKASLLLSLLIIIWLGVKYRVAGVLVSGVANWGIGYCVVKVSFVLTGMPTAFADLLWLIFGLPLCVTLSFMVYLIMRGFKKLGRTPRLQRFYARGGELIKSRMTTVIMTTLTIFLVALLYTWSKDV